ncbi:MAG: hypothetical protein KJ061_20300 [Vicinamibacteraceae bacterium]|nr:hypothetical protein [Vicinamibacteraceae bacterium]
MAASTGGAEVADRRQRQRAETWASLQPEPIQVAPIEVAALELPRFEIDAIELAPIEIDPLPAPVPIDHPRSPW